MEDKDRKCLPGEHGFCSSSCQKPWRRGWSVFGAKGVKMERRPRTGIPRGGPARPAGGVLATERCWAEGRGRPRRGAGVSSVSRAASFRFQRDVGFRRPQGGGSEQGGGALPLRRRQPGEPGAERPPAGRPPCRPRGSQEPAPRLPVPPMPDRLTEGRQPSSGRPLPVRHGRHGTVTRALGQSPTQAEVRAAAGETARDFPELLGPRGGQEGAGRGRRGRGPGPSVCPQGPRRPGHRGRAATCEDHVPPPRCCFSGISLGLLTHKDTGRAQHTRVLLALGCHLGRDKAQRMSESRGDEPSAGRVRCDPTPPSQDWARDQGRPRTRVLPGGAGRRTSPWPGSGGQALPHGRLLPSARPRPLGLAFEGGRKAGGGRRPVSTFQEET